MKIYFFDTETTGVAADGQIVQLAITERGIATPLLNELFKPIDPIPAEASAVHHITNKMVANKPLFAASEHYTRVKDLLEDPQSISVAHNAAFDVGMLEAEHITPANVICTLKVARALDITNTFTNYKLQYLRYALDMELDVGAHDALADVLVLEQLFDYLLKKTMSDRGVDEAGALEIMQQITREPSLLKNISFGKHAGKTVEEVAALDRSYLVWLLTEKRKKPEGEEDWIFTLEKYLQ